MAPPPKLALQTLLPEGTVSTEAIESSSNGGSMARKRYQKGFVYLDGDKWKGMYREDQITGEGTKRIRREVILGCKREMTKPLAERRMEVVLAGINGLDYRPGGVASFVEVSEGWKTQMLTTQKPSSVSAVRSLAKSYMLQEPGNVRLVKLGVEHQR